MVVITRFFDENLERAITNHQRRTRAPIKLNTGGQTDVVQEETGFLQIITICFLIRTNQMKRKPKYRSTSHIQSGVCAVLKRPLRFCVSS